jgi:riboflavin kinase/FMN adenylyltransferase
MHYTTTLAAHEPIAITIGNFDGIHRGHQHLMHELGTLAEQLHCRPALVTFSPHTLMIVRPDMHVYYLTTLEEKLALTRQYGGITDNIVIEFTPEVASMSATEFMDTLRHDFQLKGLVVGANFSLGHNRMGDITFLENYGREHGIIVQAIALEEIGQTRISSTRIRSLVSEGAVTEANELLGHPLTLSGVVVHGNERGRLLGFPTANLRPDSHRLLPANGVYAVRAYVAATGEGQQEGEAGKSDVNPLPTVYNGVANIGVRPTFNGTVRQVEVHLFDVDLDLYDKVLTVEFLAHLRAEQRFPGIDALKTQIAADAQQARQILQNYSVP